MQLSSLGGPPARLLFHKIPVANIIPCTLPVVPFRRPGALSIMSRTLRACRSKSRWMHYSNHHPSPTHLCSNELRSVFRSCPEQLESFTPQFRPSSSCPQDVAHRSSVIIPSPLAHHSILDRTHQCGFGVFTVISKPRHKASTSHSPVGVYPLATKSASFLDANEHVAHVNFGDIPFLRSRASAFLISFSASDKVSAPASVLDSLLSANLSRIMLACGSSFQAPSPLQQPRSRDDRSESDGTGRSLSME